MVILKSGDRVERGSAGGGGRYTYPMLLDTKRPYELADEAIRIADVNLTSKPCKAGNTTVVLGSGWPGVLLHEAVGHGLEGDFNRKKTSNFSDLIGQKVASDLCTVIDDGTIKDRRGSLSIDDEGTPTAKNTLIENGILKGYMQDLMNAKLMDVKPTGNGRRESYAHLPMPRMTNTYMLGGTSDANEIIESVKDGIYAVNFSGGQVDITSGQFVFTASEAYKIEYGWDQWIILRTGLKLEKFDGHVFVYDKHTVSKISSDIKWSPTRGAPAASSWPPRGLHLEVSFQIYRDIEAIFCSLIF